MSRKTAARKTNRGVQSHVCSLRYFLAPALFRQLYRRFSRYRNRRWALQPLLFTVLCMTWCLGDSQPERFETARAFYVVVHPKRRRPGKSFQGFQKALKAVPCSLLRVVADLLRKQLLRRFGSLLHTDGWFVLGCDGTRLRAPRCEELEQRLGDSGGDDKAGSNPPQVWLTVVVHLASGVPWAWLPGKGDASERNHLLRMCRWLPKAALIVTDAGYQSYALAREIANHLFFLMRVSVQTTFYVPDTNLETSADKNRQVTQAEMEKWTDGEVYYWPKKEGQQQGNEPIKVRLIRIAAKKRKNDVWLVTNVLDTTRLPVEMASKFYRMRWENEGFFRTYKRTMNKLKLSGRTVATVHREVLGSLLAVQILLAQGMAARLAMRNKRVATSARQLVLLVRREMNEALRGRTRRGFLQRAAGCQREQRSRTSKKQKREWVGRKAPKALHPPKIRKMDEDLKGLFEQCLAQAV
jgi:Transposase DDE domain